MASHTITACQYGLTLIDGIVDSSLSPGIQLLLAGADGKPWNSQVFAVEIRPVASFTTLKIKHAIDTFGIDGFELDATPLDIYTLNNDQGGSRGTTGEKLSVTKGIIVPRSLDLAQGQRGTITYDVYAGGTAADAAPVTATSAQTPPTIVATSEVFTLGGGTLNAAALAGIVSAGIDFGFSVEQDMSDGYTYPVQVYISGQQPTISIDTILPTALVAVTLPGSTNVITVIANALVGTNQTFTTHKNIVAVDSVGGSHPDRAVTRIVCTPVWDGTNAPITVS